MSKLDELLGRTQLKERIADLEAEVDRLESRYEAESERRAEAVRERQTAQEALNRLEDRIAQLEGELDRVTVDEVDLEYRKRDRLGGGRLEALLDRLASTEAGPEGALTAWLADASTRPNGVEPILDDRLALAQAAAPCLLCVDDLGLVSVTLRPPVDPDLDGGWADRFALEREWFLPTGRYRLALVRADLFALGTYQGDERIAYRGFESDVKSDHSKGGFSQARFERIREGQIDDHLERCRETLTEAEDASAPLYLVGQRDAVDRLADDLEKAPDAVTAVDATGKPESALEDAVDAFWKTDVRVI